jgi:triacylglycerol lipase
MDCSNFSPSLVNFDEMKKMMDQIQKLQDVDGLSLKQALDRTFPKAYSGDDLPFPQEFKLSDGGSLSIHDAYMLACAASLAYEEEAIIKQWATAWKMTNTEVFNNQVNQCFVMGNDEIIVVSFRGTNAWLDEIQDAMSAPMPISLENGVHGNVHRGFYRFGVQLLCSDDFLSCITKFRDNKEKLQKIWITGHSLGGAMALLAATSIGILNDFTGLYTFGQPTSGDSVFTSSISPDQKNKFFRFVNANDPVPMVIPRVTIRDIAQDDMIDDLLYYLFKYVDLLPWVWFKDWIAAGGLAILKAFYYTMKGMLPLDYPYEHVGSRHVHLFETKNITKYCIKENEYISSPLLTIVAIKLLTYFWYAGDHSIDNYVKKLEKLSGSSK